jgi:tRNA(fMet)-specific endonuclease VapC
VPYVLDTDTTTLLEPQTQPAYDYFHAHLARHPGAEVFATIVGFQEHVRGWLAFLSRVKPSDQVVFGYTALFKILHYFCQAKVLTFDDAAQSRFQALRSRRVRIGTLDLRIACIASTVGATVLTRNLRDFRQVPGLAVEDWTQAPKTDQP